MSNIKSEFEKAYEPNPHKSPFTEVRFNDEKQIYEPLNPPLDHVARSLNAAWYGYRIRQTEVDALTLQVAEMKSRLNDAYTNGPSAMYTARQSKINELQKQVTDLDNRATKYALDSMATAKLNVELQKRVDAAKYYMKNIFSGDAEVDQCHLGDLLDILDGKIVDEIEQALKGEQP